MLKYKSLRQQPNGRTDLGQFAGVDPGRYYSGLMGLGSHSMAKHKHLAHAKVSTRFLGALGSDSDVAYSGKRKSSCPASTGRQP